MLRSTYYSQFKNDPKVLFWGDARALHKLSSLLRAGSIGTGALSLDPFSEAIDRKTVVIKSVRRSRGMRIRGANLEWALERKAMTKFADIVEGLADTGTPGHQYLTCNVDDEITVMVSCGEYPDDFRPYEHAN